MERIISRSRLPYGIACVVIGCLVGAPGYFVFYFLDSLNPSQALTEITSSFFFSINNFGLPLPLAQGLADDVLATVFFILTLYFVRYMRITSLNVEPCVAKVLPDYSEGKSRDFFGGLSNMRFVLLMTALFSLAYAPPRIVRAPGVFSLLSVAILIPLDFFIVSVALWIYLKSLWGVYKLGSKQLKLIPYHRDRVLGLHPIGAMTLSFAVVYLLLDTIALAAGVITGDFLNLLVLLGLLVLLAVMLVLPVQGMHQKMLLEKNREKSELQKRITSIVSKEMNEVPEKEDTAFSDLKYLIAYRTLSVEVGKISTWPFETSRLERFLAVFLSITAIILARLIQLAFHF